MTFESLTLESVDVRPVVVPLKRPVVSRVGLFSEWPMILIDLHWYDHCYGAIETARACKEILPSAWTILGGLTASGFARGGRRYSWQ